MSKFYFVYKNCEGSPFTNGWSTVIAPTLDAARALFRAVHPDYNPGELNCSLVYTKEQFKKTEMYEKGNGGKREHEIIKINAIKPANAGPKAGAKFNSFEEIRQYCCKYAAQRSTNKDAVILSDRDTYAMSTDNVTVSLVHLYNNPKNNGLAKGYGMMIGCFEYKVDGEPRVWRFYYNCISDKLENILYIECDRYGNVGAKRTDFNKDVILYQLNDIISPNPTIAMLKEAVASVRAWSQQNKERFCINND